jgi:hypothetical protein
MREQYINGFPVVVDVGGIDNVSGILPVSAVAPVTGGFRILIESEKMLVTSGGTSTSWTVTRGIEGTTASAHTAGTVIYVILTAGSLDQIRQDVSGYGTSLPSSGMKAGDKYVMSTTSVPYIYTGSVWQPYGYTNVADLPPTSPTPYDDEFNGPTLDPKWLLNNPSSVPNTSYSTYFNNSWYSVDVTVSSTQARVLSWVQPAPSGAWSFRAKMAFDCATWQYFGFGLLARNQAAGKDIWGGLLYHASDGTPTFYVQRDTGGTFTSEVDCYNNYTGIHYIQMSYDGSSNLTWYHGVTGAKYTIAYTETISNFISAPPTYVGFTIHPWGDSSSNPRIGMCASIDWFRRVA